MRRLLALLTAMVLVASLAGSSVAAAPTAKVNHVLADFNLLDEQGTAVGRVVADFRESGWDRYVPGTLDVYWADYAQDDPPFPFTTLTQNWQIRESHAQLGPAGFNMDPGGLVGGSLGYLCDYANPWDMGCRPFWVQFRIESDGYKHVTWGVSLDAYGDPNQHIADFAVGSGVFVLTYAGQTP